MARFDLDLSSMSTERKVMQAGQYPASIIKSDVKTGDTKDGEGKWMSIQTVYVVKDEDVINDLGVDEPKVYGNFFIRFDKDTGLLSNDNPQLAQLGQACGIDTTDELYQEGIEDSMNDFEAYTVMFTNIANSLPGYDVLVNVTRRAQGDNIRAEVSKVAKLEA
jgi:hypothetical protein